jgi:Transposase DDE domain
VLRVFGLTDFLFRPFDFAGILDCPTLGSARGSRFQPFCQCRVGRPCAKLFERDLSWRSMKSGCLKPAIYFDLVSRPRISIWHGLFSSTHAPAYDRRFNWAAGIHTVPSAVTPSAQKWNDIGAGVILAKKLKRLVRRRNTFVGEGVDTCRLKMRCCPNDLSRRLLRSIYEQSRDVARAIVCTSAFEQSRRDRKRVEMLFAHLKRILRLGRLRLRGPSGAQFEFTLGAIAQNLRRFAKLIARPPPTVDACPE